MYRKHALYLLFRIEPMPQSPLDDAMCYRLYVEFKQNRMRERKNLLAYKYIYYIFIGDDVSASTKMPSKRSAWLMFLTRVHKFFNVRSIHLRFKNGHWWQQNRRVYRSHAIIVENICHHTAYDRSESNNNNNSNQYTQYRKEITIAFKPIKQI